MPPVAFARDAEAVRKWYADAPRPDRVEVDIHLDPETKSAVELELASIVDQENTISRLKKDLKPIQTGIKSAEEQLEAHRARVLQLTKNPDSLARGGKEIFVRKISTRRSGPTLAQISKNWPDLESEMAQTKTTTTEKWNPLS